MARAGRRKSQETIPLGGDGTIAFKPDDKDQELLDGLCDRLGYDQATVLRMGMRWLAWLETEIRNGRDVQSACRATGRTHKVRIADFEVRQ